MNYFKSFIIQYCIPDRSEVKSAQPVIVDESLYAYTNHRVDLVVIQHNYTMIYFKFTPRFICCTMTNQFRILSDSLQLVFFDFE